MTLLYVLLATAAISLAHFNCWPAVAALVVLGSLMVFAADLRAVHLKRKTRRTAAVKQPAAA